MRSTTFVLALKLRARTTIVASSAMAALLVMIGALYPSIGESFGQLDLPEGVADLLGGANFGTLSGWIQAEIGSIYGPGVLAGVAITGAVALTAAEEEAGIFSLILAHPVDRSRLVLAKGGAAAASTCMLGVAMFIGLVGGVAIAGGGISISNLAAFSVHMLFFGLTLGALALALAAATGARGLALGAAAGFGVLAWMINGFAPLVSGIEWLKYLTPFYYYDANDPLTNGIDITDIAVLAAATVILTAIAAVTIRRRDVRG